MWTVLETNVLETKLRFQIPLTYCQDGILYKMYLKILNQYLYDIGFQLASHKDVVFHAINFGLNSNLQLVCANLLKQVKTLLISEGQTVQCTS